MVLAPPIGGPPLVLYDGQCGFCAASVRWLLARDPEGRFRFAPLQGETATAILARHPELPPGLDSIVLVEAEGGAERVSWHSRAVFRILRRLGGAWGLVARFAALIPRPLADFGYRLFARLRYRVWGRLDACRLPTAAERERFLP